MGLLWETGLAQARSWTRWPGHPLPPYIFCNSMTSPPWSGGVGKKESLTMLCFLLRWRHSVFWFLCCFSPAPPLEEGCTGGLVSAYPPTLFPAKPLSFPSLSISFLGSWPCFLAASQDFNAWVWSTAFWLSFVQLLSRSQPGLSAALPLWSLPLQPPPPPFLLFYQIIEGSRNNWWKWAHAMQWESLHWTTQDCFWSWMFCSY